MANYILTNKAVEDLSKIWDYTFEVRSETQADRYYYMLLDSCQEIADEKVRGKSYPEVLQGVLGIKVGLHIIFYRKSKGTSIEIARILHSRIDLKNRMHDKTTTNKCIAGKWGLTLKQSSAVYFQSTAVRADAMLIPNLYKAMVVTHHPIEHSANIKQVTK